jgi:hypothetical protein
MMSTKQDIRDLGELTWFKSSYSGSGGGNCVEVASCPGAVHVRDSKDTTVPGLSLSPATWAAFIDHVARD